MAMALRLFAGCFRPPIKRRSQQVLPHPASEEHILGKQSAIAAITGLYSSPPAHASAALLAGCYDGIGVLVYPSLLLTTHTTIPSPAAAQNAVFSLRSSPSPSTPSQGSPDPGYTILQRKLLPQLFFATDSKLNVTVIGCEFVNPDLHPLGLSSKSGEVANLMVGSKAYILGHDKNGGGPIGKLSVGSASVTSSSVSCIEFAPDKTHECWLPGSAGFDPNGNFSFLVTETQADKDLLIRGISIPTIKCWLEPHWHTNTTTSSQPPTTIPLPACGRRATYTVPQTRPIASTPFIAHSQSEVIRTDHLKIDHPILEDSILFNKGNHHTPSTTGHAENAEMKPAEDKRGHIGNDRVANLGEEMSLSEKMGMLSIESDGYSKTENHLPASQSAKFTLQVRDHDSTNKKRKATGHDHNANGDGNKKLSLHEAFRQERRSLQFS